VFFFLGISDDKSMEIPNLWQVQNGEAADAWLVVDFTTESCRFCQNRPVKYCKNSEIND
jgi:hypothetical protein